MLLIPKHRYKFVQFSSLSYTKQLEYVEKSVLGMNEVDLTPMFGDFVNELHENYWYGFKNVLTLRAYMEDIVKENGWYFYDGKDELAVLKETKVIVNLLNSLNVMIC